MSADDHGSASTYTNHGCRCEACRDAWASAVLRMNRKRRIKRLTGEATPPHGTASTYNNYGCRCAECRTAKATSNAAMYQRRKAAVQ